MKTRTKKHQESILERVIAYRKKKHIIFNAFFMLNSVEDIKKFLQELISFYRKNYKKMENSTDKQIKKVVKRHVGYCLGYLNCQKTKKLWSAAFGGRLAIGPSSLI